MNHDVNQHSNSISDNTIGGHMKKNQKENNDNDMQAEDDGDYLLLHLNMNFFKVYECTKSHHVSKS